MGEQSDLEKYVELRKVAKLVTDLHTDHQQLERRLDEMQRETRFYQTRFQVAEQIVNAAKDGHVDTPRGKPDFIEDEKKMLALRNLCKASVYANWSNGAKPTTLQENWVFSRNRIRDLVDSGAWPSRWSIPGKRTMDRRMNEAADARCWEDGVTPIIAIKPGLYMPNPACFEPDVREKLIALAESLRPRR